MTDTLKNSLFHLYRDLVAVEGFYLLWWLHIYCQQGKLINTWAHIRSLEFYFISLVSNQHQGCLVRRTVEGAQSFELTVYDIMQHMHFTMLRLEIS